VDGITMDESTVEIAGIWREYKAHGAPDTRERLILHYAPLVKFVAGRVGAGLPHSIEQCDLVSYGILGLIDAIDRFDPDLGYKFETFVVSRIRGAIIDELRAMDWAPRSVRSKHRAIETAASKLENELRRTPDDTEMAAELGMTENHLARSRREVSLVGIRALDELLPGSSELGSGTTLGDTVPGGGHDPAAEVESQETSYLLADAIGRMPDRERLVLALYYYESLTLAQIGNALGVTESRVCQIHRKSIAALRNEMAKSLVPQ
jgi:RNA polymerase sigma factor for flagellar operon FliA